MRTQNLEVKLLAPAFLGDASQSGVWRTPPFKALLREWWRIAAAPDHGHDHRRLRELEGALLGNAWLYSGATQSKVRLALKHWDTGTLTKSKWNNDDPRETHPEVGKVGSQLYLGYGPLKNEKGTGTTLKANAALQAEKTNTLSLAWPETESSIPHTLQLIDWFGTTGGRSRNGWGSLALLPLPPGEGRGEGLRLEPLTKEHPQLTAVLRDLSACLRIDWPHAVGKDGSGPLVWESTENFGEWPEAMRFLARTKIDFRTHLKFPDERPPHRQPQERHLLAYPVGTKHVVQGWGGNTRLANQLRFKLFRDAHNKLRVRIYHTPHASPSNLPMPNLDQLAIWQKVHHWLDDATHGLQRLGARS